MTEPTQTVEVVPTVGQVWADNDWRSAGRTIEITEVTDGYVHAIVRTDSGGNVRSSVGNSVRILRRRFRPTSTGYRLIDPSTGGRDE